MGELTLHIEQIGFDFGVAAALRRVSRARDLIVEETQNERVNPCLGVPGIFHTSGYGGAGELDEGTCTSRRSACEVLVRKKMYRGSQLCRVMKYGLFSLAG